MEKKWQEMTGDSCQIKYGLFTTNILMMDAVSCFEMIHSKVWSMLIYNL